MSSSSNESRAALILIDVLSDLEFPGGEKVLPWATKMAGPLAAVRAAAHRAGVPVIYANDNFGDWRSDPKAIYRHVTRKSARGRGVARRLKPAASDYFILKPKHSAFYATPLVPLLEHLQARTLILTGIATNLCVLFTAHDAHMRDFRTIALSDCCAAENDFDHDMTLKQLQTFCRTTVCRSDELNLKTLKVKPARRR